jgi:hypothetical protein
MQRSIFRPGKMERFQHDAATGERTHNDLPDISLQIPRQNYLGNSGYFRSACISLGEDLCSPPTPCDRVSSCTLVQTPDSFHLPAPLRAE